MMLQLEDLFKKITAFESTLQTDIQHIYKKLRSKVNIKKLQKIIRIIFSLFSLKH